MRVVIALFVGLVIGGGAVWFLGTSHGKSAVHSTGDQLESTTKTARDSIQERLRAWDLRPEDVKEDLAKTGEVIRDRARQATQALADSTADARITAAIKRKLLTNKDTSALNISVNTTSGVVTLSGPVGSTDEISKAMVLAMDTEGVRRVISTMQVKPKAAKQS
jgi:hyperosmotically inducible periplasmic protein